MSGRDDRNLRAALAYAKAGWRVFPCTPGEKVPATSNGVKDATSDEWQIRAWWEKNPGRNVAIACGYPGPDVLDIDRKPDGSSGFPALRMLRAAGLIPSPRAMVRTPNDGAHLYFAPTPGAGNGSVRSAHIDHRGEGGYVVAPPSEVRRAADGTRRPYVVVHHQASADRIDWTRIREHLDPQRERIWKPPAHVRDGGQQNLNHLVARMADQPEGNRNGFLHWAANRVLDHGQDERLTELANAAVAAGLPRREADRTITSARQQPRQDPHATPQPRGQTRLTPRHQPEPAKGASAAKAAGRQQEPPARVAVQTVGHGGPERAESSPEPTQAPDHAPEPQAGQGRTEHHQAEPVAREPGRERGHQAQPEHDAASEPSRGQAASPFAQARPEPEPEAGE